MRSVVGAGLDVVGVLVFVAVGRATHDEGGGVSGFVEAAWPFLAGGCVGWVVSRGWRRPEGVWPVGVVVWVTTVGVGMVLRGVAGQGTAVVFVVVASLFLGVVLLGWRGVAALWDVSK
ncbi:DUF3054 domain-containing protein [Actinomadura sp. KC06]|uniref:DUF3054 domain-containing protein n=1 Tax=Actinomadura sp. KC06 TaxID=2530369 RepID=UPI00104F0628|nr:DUF3054 domain-containing protein [Actinomadura sp. KC06]TDD39191.1 DUF3054 domain-containing protein [Actinomadura sp. KC06]